MFKNNKLFLPPPQDGCDFKVLFKRVAAAGGGRPLSKDGFPSGPWTPELLADAITQMDPKRVGVDLRTVQLWFADNDKGISATNIGLLARVLGCDDPAATSQWQMALKEAQSRLTTTRKKRVKQGNIPSDLPPDQETVINDNFVIPADTVDENASLTGRKWSFFLSNKIESLFGSNEPMNVLIFMWAIYAFIGLVNFIMGVGSVDYSPIEGVKKQIGFIWAPTWNILPLIILPLYILFINKLLIYWINFGRFNFNGEIINAESSTTWTQRFQSFSSSFNIIVFLCFFLVFGAQWFGVYVRLYITGSPESFQIDRNLLALIRPDIISIPESVIISGLGYMYTALYIGLYLIGLLFMYIVMVDFHELSKNNAIVSDEFAVKHTQNVTSSLRIGIFRCAILGLWIAMCIKLQVVYLSSDSENMMSWLLTDLSNFFGVGEKNNGWLEQRSLTNFTTLLMVVLTFTVSLMCFTEMYFADKRMYKTIKKYNQHRTNAKQLTDMYQQSVREYISIILCISLLSASILLIGVFTGFSMLLILCVVISFYCCCYPDFKRREVI